MSTATLSNVPATQLTFAWDMPKAECDAVIVADRGPKTETRKAESRLPREQAARSVARFRSIDDSAAMAVGESSLADAMEGDRIGRPFRVGSVMFRLLKSYGITDEEIAEGIAQYTAKQNSRR